MKIDIQLSDFLYIIGIFGTAVAGFITAKYTLREYVREEVRKLIERIHEIEVDVERMKFQLLHLDAQEEREIFRKGNAIKPRKK